MTKTSDSCLPPQAVVLVTGANGFIASHIIDKLLQAGYIVRGTVRSTEKQKWLQERFDAAYGEGRFELCPVLDITAPHAFDEAVKGLNLDFSQKHVFIKKLKVYFLQVYLQ